MTLLNAPSLHTRCADFFNAQRLCAQNQPYLLQSLWDKMARDKMADGADVTHVGGAELWELLGDNRFYDRVANDTAANSNLKSFADAAATMTGHHPNQVALYLLRHEMQTMLSPSRAVPLPKPGISGTKPRQLAWLKNI